MDKFDITKADQTGTAIVQYGATRLNVSIDAAAKILDDAREAVEKGGDFVTFRVDGGSMFSMLVGPSSNLLIRIPQLE